MTHAVSLDKLIARLPHATVMSNITVEVTGITHDSRAVRPGCLFVCLRGQHSDGHMFAEAAVQSGAVGLVVCTDGLATAGYQPPENIAVITVPDTRKALPVIACAFYDDPSHSLTMVGITGTNGKTTTTRMIAAILRAAGKRVGTIGTLGAEIDGAELPSAHTTPEADQLQGLLAQMRDAGAEAVVMEVSSHALAQNRTDGIAFNVGVFTNLTQDHLDFHITMDAYFEAKSRLFSEYPIRYPRLDGTIFASVINVSQWEGRDLVTMARGDVLTFATVPSDPAVLRADEIKLSPAGSQFKLLYDAGIEQFNFDVILPIGGAFQVGNALAAIGTALKLRVPREVIARGLAEMTPVPGRFEALPALSNQDQPFSVIVDYAHTPDGLENLLRSARELKPNRLLCVFGCGGDRDRTKRPIMGRLAATLADVAIVTSDNPRHEQPDTIIEEILAGINERTNTIDSTDFTTSLDPSTAMTKIRAEIHVEPDRRAAIALAIGIAQPGDIVLLAGKGHEDYQIIGDVKHHFDDREVAQEALAALATRRDSNLSPDSAQAIALFQNSAGENDANMNDANEGVG